MKRENVWRLPATLFLIGLLAMLVAGAWREMETPARAASVINLPDSNGQPHQGEPQSNEIPDFPQLD